MMRRLSLLVAFALSVLYVSPVAAQAVSTPKILQWGVGRPAGAGLDTICAYDRAGVCQTIGTLPQSGGPMTLAPAQVPFAIQRTGDTFGAGTLGFPSIPASQDLTYAGTTTDPNAIKLGAGNSISFCPLLSCVNTGAGGTSPNPAFYDHQRATAFLSATTQIDAQAEEQTLAVTTVANTGFKKAYAASTAYNVGDVVGADGQDYRACTPGATTAAQCVSGVTTTAAGTTGTAGVLNTTAAPSSAPSFVTDGGVTWMWINAASIDGKLGIYNEFAAAPGSGATWAAATNYHMQPGLTPTQNTLWEADFANNSGANCAIGVANCYGIALSNHGANTASVGFYNDAGNAANTVTTAASSNSTTLQVASTANMVAGNPIYAVGIGVGTTISSITSATTLVLSAAATVSSGTAVGALVNYGWIWGERFTGYNSLTDIGIDTNSPNGIAFNGFGAPTAHSNAAIFDASLGPYSILNIAAKTAAAFADQSNSRATLFSSGSHSAGDIVLNTTSPNSILFQGSQHTTSISDTSAGAYGYQNIANKTTAAFADQSNSNAVLFGSGAHAAGDIVLNTSSPTSFLSQGSHTIGIQLLGSYSQYAISSPGYAVTGAGATIQTTAKLTPVAVANLPTCNAAAEGTFAAVNDLSGTLAYNGAVAGGGSTHIPVYCNGTNWTQH